MKPEIGEVFSSERSKLKVEMEEVKTRNGRREELKREIQEKERFLADKRSVEVEKCNEDKACVEKEYQELVGKYTREFEADKQEKMSELNGDISKLAGEIKNNDDDITYYRNKLNNLESEINGLSVPSDCRYSTSPGWRTNTIMVPIN